jgi:hypothetical protein
MKNTYFKVNKESLFLKFCSKAEGYFKRQPVLTGWSAKARTMKEKSRRMYCTPPIYVV